MTTAGGRRRRITNRKGKSFARGRRKVTGLPESAGPPNSDLAPPLVPADAGTRAKGVGTWRSRHSGNRYAVPHSHGSRWFCHSVQRFGRIRRCRGHTKDIGRGIADNLGRLRRWPANRNRSERRLLDRKLDRSRHPIRRGTFVRYAGFLRAPPQQTCPRHGGDTDRTAATGWWRPTVASSVSVMPRSTDRPEAFTSTSPSSAWPPRPPGTGTGSWRPTVASSASETPASTDRPEAFTSTSPSSAWPPRPRHGYWLVASDGGIFSFGSRLLRIDRAHPPEPTHRRHGSLRPTVAATGSWPPTGASSPSAMPAFYGSTGRQRKDGLGTVINPSTSGYRSLVQSNARKASTSSGQLARSQIVVVTAHRVEIGGGTQGADCKPTVQPTATVDSGLDSVFANETGPGWLGARHGLLHRAAERTGVLRLLRHADRDRPVERSDEHHRYAQQQRNRRRVAEPQHRYQRHLRVTESLIPDPDGAHLWWTASTYVENGNQFGLRQRIRIRS